MTRARYLLVLDEPHHVAEGSSWHDAVQRVMDRMVFCLLMTGTPSRNDGQHIAFLPYKEIIGGKQIVDLAEIGLNHRTIIYSRSAALDEHAVLPIYFNRIDVKAEWLNRIGVPRRVETFKNAGQETSDALFTALTQSYAHDLLKAAVEDWIAYRENYNKRG